MAFLLKALALLTLVYVHLGEAAVPDRCLCMNFMAFVKKENIEEFSVSSPTKNCNNTEIIVTLKNKGERCLNPDKHQAKNLQICWKSKNVNNTSTLKISECFGERRPQEDKRGSLETL